MEKQKIEKWRPIKGEWGQFYAVSNEGRVKSLTRTIQGWKSQVTKKERIIKPSVHQRSGMLCFRAWAEGRAKVFFIHRLVAQCFIRKPKHLTVVAFKDGDVLNVDSKNLYWTKSGELIKAGIAKSRAERAKESESLIAE